MTYEEKFDIVVKAIKEARKMTPDGYNTKLKITYENKLQDLDLDDISSILYKLNDQRVIKMISTANAKFISGLDPWLEEQDYFALDVLDTFNDWYEDYIMQQKSEPANLAWLNLLKVLDVCSDIDQKLQITGNTTVAIPSFPYPYLGRFLELFPYDSIGTRKSYQQYRWEGAQYLLKQGIATDVRDQTDDVLGYGNIVIKIDPVKFNDFHKTIKDKFEKWKKSAVKENKLDTPKKIGKTAKDEVVWPDDFRWEGKDFVFGKYGSIGFISSDRKHILKALTDKKGGWATISELKGNKDAGYVRSTIKQIEDRLPKEAREHIKIVSTQEDDSVEKPNAGAYRIKVQP